MSHAFVATEKKFLVASLPWYKMHILVNLRNFEKNEKCVGKLPVIIHIKARVLLVIETFNFINLIT